MSSRHLASGDDDERGKAVDRLRSAVAERKQVRGSKEAEGTQADAAASDPPQPAARQENPPQSAS